MKKLFSTISILLFVFATHAQSKEGVVKYDNKQYPAAVIELPYSAETVKDAMEEYRIKKERSKTHDLKGFSTFRNMEFNEEARENADLYFKVHSKKNDKATTIVCLLLTGEKDGLTNNGNVNHLNMQEALNYLNALTPSVIAYDLGLQIEAQNKILMKAELKYKGLTHEMDNIDKTKTELKKKIEEQKAMREELIKKLMTLLNHQAYLL